MTVSTEVDHNEYTGNGVTTTFPYTFRIFKNSDLVVQVVDLNENITVLVLDADYTVTGAGGYVGGNVILSSALANGYQISVSRELPVTQDTDLRNQGKFFAEVHEDAFDKLTMLIQQLRSWFSLALRKPSFVANYYDALNNYIRNLRDPVRPHDAATKNYADTLSAGNNSHAELLFSKALRTPESIPELPGVEQRKNKIVAMNDVGEPIMVLPESGSAADVLIELAKSDGAEKIGYQYKNNDTSAHRRVNDKLDEHVSVLDFHRNADGGLILPAPTVDSRPFFERALVYIESIGGGTIYVPAGKYYLNSYSEIGTIGTVFNAILPLCDNVKILLDTAAEIVVGTFFDDKPFQLFFGSSPLKPNLVDAVNNVVIEGGTISFSGDSSMMRVSPLIRIAVQTGNVSNLRITNVTFREGDLTNALAIGWLGLGKCAVVENCNFIDLIQNGMNNDHSSIYLNASYSTINNCNFISTKDKGRKIACAVELHKSFNSWIGGNVDGYTRAAYINAIDTESSLVENTLIESVTARILHQFVAYSFGSDGVIRNSLVTGNNVTTLARSSSDTDPSEFGPCSLCGWVSYGDFNNTDGLNIVIENNTYYVDQTVPQSFSCVFYAIAKVSGVTVRRNAVGARSFFYHPTPSLVLYNCHFYDNIFDNSYVQSGSARFLYDLNCNRISESTFEAFVPVKTTVLTGVMRIDPSTLGSQNRFVVKPQNTDNIQYPFITNLSGLLGQDGTTYSYPQKCNVNIGSGSTPVLSVTSPEMVTVDRGQILNNANLPDGYVPPSALMRYGTTIVGAGVTASGTPSGDYTGVNILLIKDR